MLTISTFLLSCNRPKVIEQTEGTSIFEEQTNSSSSVFESMEPPIPMTAPETIEEINQVVVMEQLPTSRYIYLNVKNLKTNETYWIATGLMNVNNGDVYFYKTGLLKTNFESKEHNRVFEKIYLVNNLVPANHGNQAENQTAAGTDIEVGSVKPATGSVPIAEIVKNPTQYANKTVQVTGVCTKINPNIMNRHWVHLKDDSPTEYDFVITTDQLIPVGHTVTLQGTLATNKDFGAGYQYEMILENCTLIQ